jgi:hypothetical protein
VLNVPPAETAMRRVRITSMIASCSSSSSRACALQ